jgi:hypothetical protein
MWHAWEKRENCTRFWWETPNERDHSEDRDVEGRMGSEWVLGNWLDVEWVRLVQYKGQWRAVVNAVMNLRFLAPRK